MNGTNNNSLTSEKYTGAFIRNNGGQNDNEFNVVLLLKICYTLGIVIIILAPIVYFSLVFKRKIDMRRLLDDMGANRSSSTKLSRKDAYTLKSRMNRRRHHVDTIEGYRMPIGLMADLLGSVTNFVCETKRRLDNSRADTEDTECLEELKDFMSPQQGPTKVSSKLATDTITAKVSTAKVSTMTLTQKPSIIPKARSWWN